MPDTPKDPVDNVDVRVALAEFTEATGWFTSDRDVHNGHADISLTPDQMRHLTSCVKIANAAHAVHDALHAEGV